MLEERVGRYKDSSNGIRARKEVTGLCQAVRVKQRHWAGEGREEKRTLTRGPLCARRWLVLLSVRGQYGRAASGGTQKIVEGSG